MKKRMAYIVVLGFFIFAIPAGLYAGWGVGTDIGYWKMDADDLKTDMKDGALTAADSGDGYTGKITQGTINPGLRFFYEYPLKNEWLMGASLGFGKSASIKYSSAYTDSLVPADSWSNKLENTAYNIPFEFYARWKKEKIAFSGGLGLNYFVMKTEIKTSDSSGDYSGDFDKNKIVPHVSLGGEYFVKENFSLGLNLKYLFSGKVDDFRGDFTGVSGEQKLIMAYDPPYGRYLDMVPSSQALSSGDKLFGYDMSGLRINLAANYYFGGE